MITIATDGKFDKYDVNLVEQILHLGKSKKPTQVTSKYSMFKILVSL